MKRMLCTLAAGLLCLSLAACESPGADAPGEALPGSPPVTAGVTPAESEPAPGSAEESPEAFPEEAVIRRPMEGIGKSELIYGDFLQSGDVLVCSWYERKGEGSELHWMIGAFDLSSGEMRYRFPVDELVWGMEKVSYGPYDYRVLLTDRMLYRSSTDETAEEVVPLPENIALLEFGLSTRYSPCAYDYSGNAFTWAAEDGIWISDARGENARRILNNSDLPDGMGATPDAPPYLLYAPRFLCNGEKVAAALFSPYAGDGEHYAGAVLCDLETGARTELEVGRRTNGSIKCGVEDRYVISQSASYTVVLDAQTGETRKYEIHYSDLYPDLLLEARTLVRAGADENRETRFYICSLDDPDDRSHPLPDPWKAPYETMFGPRDLTESYVYFEDADGDGPWLAAVKYR